MTRRLNTRTLDQAAEDYAARFLLPSRFSWRTPEKAIDGQNWVVQSMYGFSFKDEFDYVYSRLQGWMGVNTWERFQRLVAPVFTPRRDDVFEEELATRLAIRPDGTFIGGGKLGTVQIGERIVGYRPKIITLRKGKKHEKQITIMKSIREPAFAGDLDFMGSMGALNFNMSAETALLTADAAVDNLDSEAGAAVIKGYTGAQPADPDAATTGTLLFTCVCSNPAYAAAVDDTDGTISVTASAITDDSSADATNTLTYCRVSASADGAAETDPQFDGSAGTGTVNFVFNTAAIVSGANVAISSMVTHLDQGDSAT